MNRDLSCSSSRQSGASLVVALIFLVIMAMLGVTTANVTTLQERMAGHTRDRDLALQAAEAALRDAEVRLQVQAFRDAAVTWVESNPNTEAFWEACFVGNTAPCATANVHTPEFSLPTTGADAVAAQPEYVVERRPASGPTPVYRVTVRAVGGTADAVVIIQAEY